MTTIAQKADYVKRAANADAAHHCHWPGCDKAVKPAMWGCSKHWFTLPQGLRNKIWATYKPGQEIGKTPSAAYLHVARQVQEWIKTHNAQGQRAADRPSAAPQSSAATED